MSKSKIKHIETYFPKNELPVDSIKEISDNHSFCYGVPTDVAIFLFSDLSKWTTGSDYSID